MKNTERERITVQALKGIIRDKGFERSARTVNALWSEICHADTYGKDTLVFVEHIRAAQRSEAAEWYYRRIVAGVLRGEL